MEKEKKISNFSRKKCCFINSLKEVNCFLTNINKALLINKFIKRLKK